MTLPSARQRSRSGTSRLTTARRRSVPVRRTRPRVVPWSWQQNYPNVNELASSVHRFIPGSSMITAVVELPSRLPGISSDGSLTSCQRSRGWAVGSTTGSPPGSPNECRNATDLSVLASSLCARYEADQPARLPERSGPPPPVMSAAEGPRCHDLLLGLLAGSVPGVGAPDTGINSVRAVVLLDMP